MLQTKVRFMFSRISFILILTASLAVNAGNELKLGEIPANYLGKDPSGKIVSLDDNKGKIVIISFWASWCPPCLKELPLLEKIQNKIGTKQIKVVAINFKESRKSYHKIKKRLSSLKLTLTHDRKGTIAKKFGVSAIPNLFIVGKDGTLIFHNVGYNDSSINKILTVLNEQLSI
jgi:thiol-disulfide isomerase/thioredoxin